MSLCPDESSKTGVISFGKVKVVFVKTNHQTDHL